MVDFAKLRDPAFLSEVRARIAKEEAEQAKTEEEIREAFKKCSDHEHALTDIERRFVNDTERFFRIYSRPLTDKQQKWLKDIAARFQTQDS